MAPIDGTMATPVRFEPRFRVLLNILEHTSFPERQTHVRFYHIITFHTIFVLGLHPVNNATPTHLGAGTRHLEDLSDDVSHAVDDPEHA